MKVGPADLCQSAPVTVCPSDTTPVVQICSLEPRRGDAPRNLLDLPRRGSCPLVNRLKRTETPSRRKDLVQEDGAETRPDLVSEERGGASLEAERKQPEAANSGQRHPGMGTRSLVQGIKRVHLAEREKQTQLSAPGVRGGTRASRRKVQASNRRRGEAESTSLWTKTEKTPNCFHPDAFVPVLSV